MRALGKSMFSTWSNTMMAQVNANSSTANAATYPLSTPSNTMPVPSALPAAQGLPFAAAPGASAGPHPFYPVPSQQQVAPAQQQQASAGPYPVYPVSSQQMVPTAQQQQVSAGGVAPLPARTAAEALRQSATDLTGWMSADWMNCEGRSIQLGWGDTAQLLSGPAAAAAAAPAGSGTEGGGDGDVAGVVGVGKFLWARPGQATTWFPGGLFGIV